MRTLNTIYYAEVVFLKRKKFTSMDFPCSKHCVYYIYLDTAWGRQVHLHVTLGSVFLFSSYSSYIMYFCPQYTYRYITITYIVIILIERSTAADVKNVYPPRDE